MEKVAVVAFGFGSTSALPSNRTIAKIAYAKAKELKAMVYTEPDISLDCGVSLLYVAESPSPTFRLAKAAVIQAKKDNVDVIWVVAAAPHLERCRRDIKFVAEEMLFEVAVRACNEVYQIPENNWFSSKAVQKHARSKKAWEKRNGILMKMPMWLYTRIAS